MVLGDNDLARYMRATKSFSAPSLLMRLAYWQRKAHVRVQLDDGKHYVANTLDDWAAETGLTRHQVRHAIKRLKALNFVQTKMALRGKNWMMHIRITDEAMDNADERFAVTGV